MSTLLIRLFGPGTLTDAQGNGVVVRARKELAVLAYLLLEDKHTHSRETLQSVFWPEFDPDSARNNLRVVLSHLQGLLPLQPAGQKLLITSRSDVQLNPDVNCWVDCADFQTLLDRTRRHDHTSRSTCPECQKTLTAVLDLYRDELLAGFELADCPLFEEWLFLQRERHHVLALQALYDLAIYTEQTGQLDLALTYAQRQIELDPLRESAYRQKIRILAAQGDRSAALATFERCRAIINTELGVDLEPEMLALRQQIITQKSIPDPAPPTRTSIPATSFLSPNASSRPDTDIHTPTETANSTTPVSIPALTQFYNLPQQLTPFVGREQEIEQLNQRLQAKESRLISLVGPGGMGKTRLAIQVASSNQAYFSNGVCFVPLAGVQNPAAIPAAIMDALNTGLDAGAATPVQQLLRLLAPSNLLLIIDNFEQLLGDTDAEFVNDAAVDGVGLLLAILQAAPNVTLLVTTREQLNCQAEDSFLLGGLATPTTSEFARAGHYAAVRLFCERAYRLNKTFRLTAENCADVVKICQHVEGMPLAIEIATTWLGEMDCAALVSAIEANQNILTTSQRDLPARHRSMQAVFNHSWEMLGLREQAILSQLAIAHGRFSARVAHQLTGASLVDLTRLRYKSLLRFADTGYYELHPLIRGFALAKLESAVLPLAEEKLAEIYIKQVAAQQATLYGPTPQAAIHIIGGELDNVQQAWRWAETHQRTDLLIRCVDGLGEFYSATGRNAEGEERFKPLAQALLVQGRLDTNTFRLCLHLLDRLCLCLIWRSKLADALQWAKQLTHLAQADSNTEFEVRGMAHWGKALLEQGNNSAAEHTLQQALALARQLAQPRLIGNIMIELSHTLRHLERPSAAVAILSECLEIQRTHANRTAEQRTLLYLAVCHIQDGDIQSARNYLLEALRLLQLTANRHVESRIVDAMGNIDHLIGDDTSAVANHLASRRISQEIRQPVQESHALRHLCAAHRKLGNLEQAESYGLQSLRIALDNHLADDEFEARTYLGYVWLAAGNWEAATTAFQRAAEGWRAQDRSNPVIEAEVGLATVDFRRGELEYARARIQAHLPTLISAVPYGLFEPYDMYLACYDILTAAQDAQAGMLLNTAYAQLQKHASKLTDPQLLRIFWQTAAHHRIRMICQ